MFILSYHTHVCMCVCRQVCIVELLGEPMQLIFYLLQWHIPHRNHFLFLHKCQRRVDCHQLLLMSSTLQYSCEQLAFILFGASLHLTASTVLIVEYIAIQWQQGDPWNNHVKQSRETAPETARETAGQARIIVWHQPGRITNDCSHTIDNYSFLLAHLTICLVFVLSVV